jgi:hypothetical protein
MVNVKCLTLFKRPVPKGAYLKGKFSRCPTSNKISKGDTCHSTGGKIPRELNKLYYKKWG